LKAQVRQAPRGASCKWAVYTQTCVPAPQPLAKLEALWPLFLLHSYSSLVPQFFSNGSRRGVCIFCCRQTPRHAQHGSRLSSLDTLLACNVHHASTLGDMSSRSSLSRTIFMARSMITRAYLYASRKATTRHQPAGSSTAQGVLHGLGRREAPSRTQPQSDRRSTWPPRRACTA
jgi:hypothetical protein